MRFSTIASLCAAPLALATSLEANLVMRGSLDMRTEAKPADKPAAKDGGKNVVIAASETVSITQVIIIWINQGGGAATTTVTETIAPTGAAAAVTHSVTVGGTAGLVYSPESIVAAVGDMVIFTFKSQNHTVTESAFAAPCVKLAGGMDSGFMANINNTVNPEPQMAMQVTVATPIWFYCRQSGHCGKGMVFSINPTANKTQADFKQLAIAQNGTALSTAVIAGGTAKSTTVSVAAPAASTAAAAAPAGSMVAGSGTIVAGGSCSCSCLCGVAAFPAAAQGLGAFGGLPGAMPMSAMEA